MASTNRPSVIVSDTEGRYLGTLSALDLFHRPEGQIRPPFIGGMATPFGVFLTNGEISGGAKPFALAVTGALLFGLLVVAVVATTGVLERSVSESTRAPEVLARRLPPALFFTFLSRHSPIRHSRRTHGCACN